MYKCNSSTKQMLHNSCSKVTAGRWCKLPTCHHRDPSWVPQVEANKCIMRATHRLVQLGARQTTTTEFARLASQTANATTLRCAEHQARCFKQQWHIRTHSKYVRPRLEQVWDYTYKAAPRPVFLCLTHDDTSITQLWSPAGRPTMCWSCRTS